MSLSFTTRYIFDEAPAESRLHEGQRYKGFNTLVTGWGVDAHVAVCSVPVHLLEHWCGMHMLVAERRILHWDSFLTYTAKSIRERRKTMLRLLNEIQSGGC